MKYLVGNIRMMRASEYSGNVLEMAFDDCSNSDNDLS